MTGNQADGLRDAAAWLKAFAEGDAAGFHAIAMNCNPVELVDSLTAAFLWVIRDQGLSLDAVIQLMRNTANWQEGDQ